METASQQIWKILDVLHWGTGYLTKQNVSEPRLSMEWILAKVLEVKRLDLYLRFDKPLNASQLRQIKELLMKRVQHVPIQYLLGQWDFLGFPFWVDSRALIPRPETEILVESVLNLLPNDGRNEPTYGLDLGVGSGNIAVALLSRLGRSCCVGVDVSSETLELTRLNAERHGVLQRLRLLQGSWFDPIEKQASEGGGAGGERPFDWIVSNPPYVPDEQWESLVPEVRLHEPPLALRGGPSGLRAYGPIVAGASGHLKEGGLLALEIGDGQAAAVRELIEGASGLNFLEIKKDNNGIERVILARCCIGERKSDG